MSVRVVLLLLSEQHARMSVRKSSSIFPDVYAFEYDLSERRRDDLLLLLIDSRRVVTVSAFGIRTSTRRLVLQLLRKRWFTVGVLAEAIRSSSRLRTQHSFSENDCGRWKNERLM